VTLLTWQAESSATNMDWQEAKFYCESLNSTSFGGKSNWRLPTIRELISIIDRNKTSPAIDQIFSNTKPADYWTTTPHQSRENNVFVINFELGRRYARDVAGKKSYARCVHD
jgi:hypothetical protein